MCHGMGLGAQAGLRAGRSVCLSSRHMSARACSCVCIEQREGGQIKR